MPEITNHRRSAKLVFHAGGPGPLLFGLTDKAVLILDPILTPEDWDVLFKQLVEELFSSIRKFDKPLTIVNGDIPVPHHAVDIRPSHSGCHHGTMGAAIQHEYLPGRTRHLSLDTYKAASMTWGCGNIK